NESRDEIADLVLEKHTLSSVVIEEEEHVDKSGETNDRLLLEPRRIRWARARVLAGVALVAGLTIALYFLVFKEPNPPETVSKIKSIAVLPFRPLGGDGGDD